MNQENGRVGGHSNDYEYLHQGNPPKDALVQTLSVFVVECRILTIQHGKI